MAYMTSIGDVVADASSGPKVQFRESEDALPLEDYMFLSIEDVAQNCPAHTCPLEAIKFNSTHKNKLQEKDVVAVSREMKLARRSRTH